MNKSCDIDKCSQEKLKPGAEKPVPTWPSTGDFTSSWDSNAATRCCRSLRRLLSSPARTAAEATTLCSTTKQPWLASNTCSRQASTHSQLHTNHNRRSSTSHLQLLQFSSMMKKLGTFDWHPAALQPSHLQLLHLLLRPLHLDLRASNVAIGAAHAHSGAARHPGCQRWQPQAAVLPSLPLHCTALPDLHHLGQGSEEGQAGGGIIVGKQGCKAQRLRELDPGRQSCMARRNWCSLPKSP